MPNIEVTIWILTGALSLVTILSGTIWKMIRDEAKEQAKKIDQKADQDRVHDIENRWTTELSSVRDNNEKLVNKLEQRHDRELDAMASRLSDQIRNSETNILTQIRLMIDVLKSGHRENHD